MDDKTEDDKGIIEDKGRIEDSPFNKGEKVAASAVTFSYDSESRLFYHQIYCIDYAIERFKTHKGLICSVFAGGGKTTIASRIIKAMKHRISNVIFFAPSVILEDHRRANKSYADIDMSFHPIQSPKLLEHLQTSMNGHSQNKPKGDLRSKLPLIVIDEAHILGGRIANIMKRMEFSKESSKLKKDPPDAYKFYQELMTGNYKILMLTATPISDTPFSCVPLFNLTYGYFMRNQTLLPEWESAFRMQFGKNLEPTNLMFKVFVERIKNSIIWFEGYEGLPNIPIPEIKEDKSYLCSMQGLQLSNYLKFSAIEKRQDLTSIAKKNPLDPSENFDDPYHYKAWTRNISNGTYPSSYDSILQTYQSGRKIEFIETYDTDKKLELIDQSYVDNLSNLSTKMQAMIDVINSYPSDFHGIYSDRVHKANGLLYIQKVLQITNKVIPLEEMIHNDNKTVKGGSVSETVDIDSSILKLFGGDSSKFIDYANSLSTRIYDTDGDESIETVIGGSSKGNPLDSPLYEEIKNKWIDLGKPPLLIRIDGSIPEWFKNIEIDLFNDPRNTKDKMIKFVLISPAAAFGVTFKSVKHCHLYSMSFTMSETLQVIARFRRINSGIYLDPSERTLQIHRYFAVVRGFRDNIASIDKVSELNNNSICLNTSNFRKILERYIILPQVINLQGESASIAYETGSLELPPEDEIHSINTLLTTDIEIIRSFYIKIATANIYLFAMKLAAANNKDFFNAEVERDKKMVDGGDKPATRNFSISLDPSIESIDSMEGVDKIIKYHIQKAVPFEWKVLKNKGDKIFDDETMSEWRAITPKSEMRIYVPI